MVLVIGEILFDIFPEYRRLGGAPFNFAYHLKKLGIETRFVSRIGKDAPGREILDFISAHGFDIHDIQIDDRHETGKVQVHLNRSGIPRFHIRPDAAYDHIQFDHSVKALVDQPPALIYFGTLAQRTESGFQAMQAMLSQKKTASRTLYDINLRPDCYNEKIVTASLKRTDILKLNTEELTFLKRMLGETTGDRTFIQRLFSDYGIEAVVLTAGENGSQWHTRKNHYRAEPGGQIQVIDTVGAGDAYAAIVALGDLKKWPIEKTLSLAGFFSGYICTLEGAIPAQDDIYQLILKKGGGGNAT